MHTKDTITAAKKQSLRLASILRDWARETDSPTLAARAERAAGCSTVWQGWRCPDCGRLHHMVSYGCRERLCPICAAKAARATAAQALQALPIIDSISEGPRLHWALVTLTQRNVPGEDLSAEIDRMLEAWAALRHQKPVKRTLLAWARNIEITYNAQADTYHPHVHCIVAVADQQLTMPESTLWWADRWAQAMTLDYTPVCDVRPMVSDKAVYEVSKYVCKMSSVYQLPAPECAKAIRCIALAIAGRRLKSYGGLWLKARRLIGQRDAETLTDQELADEADGLELSCVCGSSSPLVPYTLVWAGMDYKEA